MFGLTFNHLIFDLIWILTDGLVRRFCDFQQWGRYANLETVQMMTSWKLMTDLQLSRCSVEAARHCSEKDQHFQHSETSFCQSGEYTTQFTLLKLLANVWPTQFGRDKLHILTILFTLWLDLLKSSVVSICYRVCSDGGQFINYI